MKPFSLEEFGDSYAEDMRQLLGQAREAAAGLNAGPCLADDDDALHSAFAALRDLVDQAPPTDAVASALLLSSLTLWQSMGAAHAGLAVVARGVGPVVDELELMLELELANESDEASGMADSLKHRVTAWQALVENLSATAPDQPSFGDPGDTLASIARSIRERLAPIGQQTSKSASALAATLTRAFHSIRGTSENLKVASLARAAAALETLWEAVQIRFNAYQRDAGRICQRLTGCGELLDPTDTLTADRRDEIAQILEDADVFALTDGDGDGADISFEPSESIFASAMFSSTMGDSFGGGDPAESVAVDPELIAIFREEALTCVEPIDGHLRVLTGRPGDHGSLSELERLYHQLKGAAATVGMTGVQQQALFLEELFETLASAQTPISARQLEEARTRSEAIFAAIQVSFPAAGKAPKVHDEASVLPELSTIFAEEGAAACDEIELYLQQIRNVPDGTQRPDLLAELRGLLHRLKGSALISGAAEFAAEAARLQGICEDDSRIGTAIEEVTASLPRLRGLLAKFAGYSGMADSIAAVPSELEQEFPLAQVPVEVDTTSGLWDAFLEETPEILEAIERDLHALEESDTPKVVLQNLLRNHHTLKGALNTVSLDPLGAIVHQIEDMLEHLGGADVLPPTDRLSGLMFQAVDSIRMNLRVCAEGYVEVRPGYFEARVAEFIGRRSPPVASSAPALRAGHSTGAAAGSTARAESSDHGSRSKTAATEQRHVRVSAERLDGLMNLVGELVVSRARMERRVASLKGLLRELGTSRQRLSDTIDHFREQYEFYGLTGQRIRSREVAVVGSRTAGGHSGWTPTSDHGEGDAHFTELEMDRYEDINILARSLGEIDSDISDLQTQISREVDRFSEESESFSTITSGLQGEITTARMIPVDHLFLRARRPIRDAAQREHKSVRAVTSGEYVNLDKTIVDDLYTPLLHLVRNAVSHGIESEAIRLARGKDPTGTVSLSARQESGQIVIDVTDDGGGLDLAKLRRKGIERGLIPADLPDDHPRIAELIFVSGLSTKDEVTGVSGRGVGCDVVRREIERMNGHIRVQTAPGRGTTFSITMPLTLAIYRALLVKSQGKTYALPLNFADRTMAIDDRQVVTSAGVDRVEVDGDFVAIRDLSALLRINRGGERAESLVLLRLGERRICLGVDEVLGQEEIVVKSLGDVLSSHPMFSGVTISGDGELVLIMDVPGLFETLGDFKIASIDGSLPTADGQGETAKAYGGSRPVRVLYVDDSLSVRKAAEKFLTSLGVEVSMAVDGVDGMDKLRQGSFDLVFTDLEMPRLHGFDLIRDIRFIPQFHDLPVVVVTSRSGDKHRAQATKLGATDYVTKPFTQETLEKMLVQLVHATREGNRLVCKG